MNRDHSVVFEIASKYCILDSFVDYDGYSISSKGFLSTVVDITTVTDNYPIWSGFPCGSDGKVSSCSAGDLSSIPSWEDPLEKEMATLAWKISWMEEPGRLQSMGLRRVGFDWATSLSLSANLITWTTALSNSVKLSHSMWGHSRQTGHSGDVWQNWSTGEGNGIPLQYSCLENPMNSMKRQKDRICNSTGC